MKLFKQNFRQSQNIEGEERKNANEKVCLSRYVHTYMSRPLSIKNEEKEDKMKNQMNECIYASQ